MPTKDELKMLQALPLDVKIAKTKQRIREWYYHYSGQVYISFSGGKDSTVLLDLVRQEFPDVEAIFVDTGLEYPEIRDFVKSKDNVTWLKPSMRFDEVIKTYGWNYPSKDVAECIWYARKGSKWALNKLDGLDNNGEPSQFKERYKKWKYLLDSPFIFSSECCKIIKEKPLRGFEKSSSKTPFIGILADESQRRTDSWIKTGCNAFDSGTPTSQPLSFWTEQDILWYLRYTSIPYCSIYGDIGEEEEISMQTCLIGEKEFTAYYKKLRCTGEQRTGCMFCPVGCHLDTPNKYQTMKTTHPKQYDYCINNLGLGKVLDYIKVPY